MRHLGKIQAVHPKWHQSCSPFASFKFWNEATAIAHQDVKSLVLLIINRHCDEQDLPDSFLLISLTTLVQSSNFCRSPGTAMQMPGPVLVRAVAVSSHCFTERDEM
jgi:hypothetical protein